jgi:hypothetical protein
MQVHEGMPQGTAPSIPGAAKRYESIELSKKGPVYAARGNIVGSQYLQSGLLTPSHALAGDSY